MHSQCDPDANEQTVLEKRAVQYNYMFTCKVCKGQTQRAATMETGLGPKAGSTPAIMSPRDGMSGDDSMTPEHLKASTSWTGASLDNSLENEEKDDVKMGMGRGKPMSALTGKLHTKYRKYCVISIFFISEMVDPKKQHFLGKYQHRCRKAVKKISVFCECNEW